MVNPRALVRSNSTYAVIILSSVAGAWTLHSRVQNLIVEILNELVANIKVFGCLDVGLLVLPLRLEALVIVSEIIENGSLVWITKDFIRRGNVLRVWIAKKRIHEPLHSPITLTRRSQEIESKVSAKPNRGLGDSKVARNN
jgi:hypothetical protein